MSVIRAEFQHLLWRWFGWAGVGVPTFKQVFATRGYEERERLIAIVERRGDAIQFLAEGLWDYQRNGNGDRLIFLYSVLSRWDGNLVRALAFIGGELPEDADTGDGE